MSTSLTAAAPAAQAERHFTKKTVHGDRDQLTTSVGNLDISDASARRFATLLGEVVAQKLRELPAGEALVLLTVGEAANWLAISRNAIYELLRSGQLESVTIGRNRRVPALAVDDFVARLRREQHEPSQ
ncbi:helix-turn-helix domain-containing protein [Amycolatopsis sp. FDAARGOS 1241]|uniref:helix-turn-helix domain-containing protein n=1 Tax=Amycolatopsis sp. FDAARGOS 1241 TaxID=2778070 RepID=UPI00194E8350|nr:helix-turn-helix domain-containing protein [Amycolatopsis sp. FDAARGOS 1241]QRP48250.1 helix-turn-helix domain-containing protein [Amycolatopsis sp. FDAARGOS 1241]